MPLLTVLFGIVFLLFLMFRFKVSPFLGLILTCFFVGIINLMPLTEIIYAIQLGFGNTMGKIALIIVFGAMLGKLIEVSGAAQVLTDRLVEAFGLKNIQYAILLTGFLVGLPMMYNASFLVMIPLIYTLCVRTGLPLLYLGIPLAATLSIAHAFLPPHPAPTYVSTVFGADLNFVLLVGLGPVIPACLIAGIFLSRVFKNSKAEIPLNLFENKQVEVQNLPSFKVSVMVAISPVLCMLGGTFVDMVISPVPAGEHSLEFYFNALGSYGMSSDFQKVLSHVVVVIKFFSEATVALLTAVLVASFFLFIRKGQSFDNLTAQLGKSVTGIAMILLIIGAGGAFSEVLLQAGINDYIGDLASAIEFNPILLAFGIAAIIRFAVGSATVATMTAAPIVLPIAVHYQIHPAIMVLATGSGSLMFSHFNDVGFWMFKEYFNVSVKKTFQIWTVMECLVAITGLLYCLLLDRFL
ncbi:gluconate:H+ symporter [Mongoliibacter ruber]|uniref:Gnt-I system high-affinity gluconate transporter/Gnt-II system L-idonate transporter n=1 Tax=Mongoliibacter ruber TaxID=1750599 RepID=A0A2T0WVG8_9BACT|nr:gluconate:H+ symporter [Mongoliibacter ruber]PRY90688.1 Gnt-I system high-affinity gluconate transporter/Gnt-II system L-idonate transporter [Mongoliibacter ruber]